MDAYSNYIMQLSDARLREMRREAAEYSMSRAARGPRRSWWRRARTVVRRRPAAVVEPLATLSLATVEFQDEELRRSA